MSTLNIIVLGDSGVGKSTLVASLHSEESFRNDATLFDDSPFYIPTAGIRFVSESSNFNSLSNSQYQLMGSSSDASTKCRLLDTSGSEGFHLLRAGHFKKSHGAIVVFDARSRASFESALELITRLKRSVPIEVVARMPVLLLGNKVDLVSYQEHDQVDGGGEGMNKALSGYQGERGQRASRDQRITEQELVARAARLNIPYIVRTPNTIKSRSQ
jgi:small GTP-binding protein